MAYIPVYARRKNGQEPVTFIDDRLKPITALTYGICIYQEQYMQIAKELAGFTPAEAEAWLKANYTCEYMAALISSVMNTKDRVPYYVNACDEMGIEVLPPDVNASECDFAVVEGKIRFGLNAVKNVGDGAARAIIRARAEGGPFASIWDLTERVDCQILNKRALESLVKCGALDSTGASRRGM